MVSVGPLTTGPDPGRLLTPYHGDITVTASGTRLSGLDIRGRVIVRAADVTIDECVIRGPQTMPSGTGFMPLVDARHALCKDLRLRDTEVAPQTASHRWSAGVEGHDFTLLRSNVHSSVDAVNVYNTNEPGMPTGVVIDSSWLHDLAWFTATEPGIVHPSDTNTHNDCVQHQGGADTVIRNSRLDAMYRRNWGHYIPGASVPDRGTGTEADGRYNVGDLSAVMVNHNVGNTARLTIDDCEINGGYIPINAGGAGKMFASHILGWFSRNTFRAPGAPTYSINADTTWVGPGNGLNAYELDPGLANRWADTGLEVRVRYNG